jgi:putative aldouronate transport system substrate-binding protein
MEKTKRIAASMMALAMTGTLIAGCSKEKSSDESPAPTQGETKTEAGAPAAYPLKTDKTLSYWAELNGTPQSVKPTFEEIPFFQEWQKRTGVKLKFTQPPANQAKEALNILLASGEQPDMIEYAWGNAFPGGPEKAIKDG